MLGRRFVAVGDEPGRGARRRHPRQDYEFATYVAREPHVRRRRDPHRRLPPDAGHRSRQRLPAADDRRRRARRHLARGRHRQRRRDGGRRALPHAARAGRARHGRPRSRSSSSSRARSSRSAWRCGICRQAASRLRRRRVRAAASDRDRFRSTSAGTGHDPAPLGCDRTTGGRRRRQHDQHSPSSGVDAARSDGSSSAGSCVAAHRLPRSRSWCRRRPARRGAVTWPTPAQEVATSGIEQRAVLRHEADHARRPGRLRRQRLVAGVLRSRPLRRGEVQERQGDHRPPAAATCRR